MADALKAQGRPEEALPYALEAVERNEAVYGTGSSKHVAALNLLADVYTTCGDVEAAAALRDEALTLKSTEVE